jgi:hypothetical protein
LKSQRRWLPSPPLLKASVSYRDDRPATPHEPRAAYLITSETVLDSLRQNS